jgi:hypothetical protein
MEPESKRTNPTVTHEPYETACDSMPDFTRLRYFHGQMLVANDLQTEQDYFREKLKMHNRCLHGYGTVCGLKVVAIKDDPDYEPPPDYKRDEDDNDQEERHKYKHHPKPVVEIECGFALDCEGNELVVRHPLRVNLWENLEEEERHRFDRDERCRLWLSICYCVQPIDPVRPVLPDACSAVSECVYSKLRDSVKVKVSTEEPRRNHCRDNCCEKCEDKCLLLASIDFERGRPIQQSDIRNRVRRWISTYEPVTITGVNWVHGAEKYTPDEASRIMQDQGLIIEFSRPILPETVTRGVMDVLIFQGGRGPHAGIYFLDGRPHVDPKRPNRIIFRDQSNEGLEDADKVLIILRTDFILDKCCRPVDGNHTGGRVPLLGRYADNKPKNETPPVTVCPRPPNRYGAWTSGNGNPGGTFESWFYIEKPPRRRERPPYEETRDEETEDESYAE